MQILNEFRVAVATVLIYEHILYTKVLGALNGLGPCTSYCRMSFRSTCWCLNEYDGGKADASCYQI